MVELDKIPQLLNLLENYKGRITGVIIALFAALLIINFGIILAIFIISCMGIGYYIGMRYDNREDFKEIINDIFSPKE